MVWDGLEEWCGMGLKSGVGWARRVVWDGLEEWCGMGLKSGVGCGRGVWYWMWSRSVI